jgi:hypothetical protein
MSESFDYREEQDVRSENAAREDWDLKAHEFRNMSRDIAGYMEKVYGDDEILKWSEVVGWFVGRLIAMGAKRDQLRKIAAYHLLIGSTTDYDKHAVFDLQGKLSIVNFMKETLVCLKQMEALKRCAKPV